MRGSEMSSQRSNRPLNTSPKDYRDGSLQVVIAAMSRAGTWGEDKGCEGTISVIYHTRKQYCPLNVT